MLKKKLVFIDCVSYTAAIFDKLQLLKNSIFTVMSNSGDGDADSNFVSISVITSDKEELWQRLQELQEFYCTQFGFKPMFFVRVPGRINIIGEHVDYCGYPVLPMAIEQCILLAVSFTKKNAVLQLRNLESQKFQNYEGDLNNLGVDLYSSNGPKWYKYYLCGIQGIYETIDPATSPIGMTVAVSGTIPLASGLSSSSALVSAATLATAHVHQLPLERNRLATISANCERYIGTQGGGMDQAIAYLANEGYAYFIEFKSKLQASPIRLPERACFVVANSLVEKEKAASSDFNERVVECRLSCLLLAKRLNIPNWHKLTHLAQLQEELNCSLAELDSLAEKFLKENKFTRSEIRDELGVNDQEFIREFLTENTKEMAHFKLKQRAHHVLQESIRVLKFRALCEHASVNTELESTTEKGFLKVGYVPNTSKDLADVASQSSVTALLSQLMQQSHHSLKHEYECSHPDLDRLVDISAECDVSARLTGAGWGGCIVALCNSIETSEKYIKLLKEKYFSSLPMKLREEHQHNNFQDVVFTTFPSNGAQIFMITDTRVDH